MHGASGIQLDVFRFRANDDTPVLRFGDVVTQGPSHRVERQGSIRQTLDEFNRELDRARGELNAVGELLRSINEIESRSEWRRRASSEGADRQSICAGGCTDFAREIGPHGCHGGLGDLFVRTRMDYFSDQTHDIPRLAGLKTLHTDERWIFPSWKS